MKKNKLAVCTILTLVFSLTVLGASAMTTDSSENPLDVSGFLSITQEDYDTGFINYADSESTLSLPVPYGVDKVSDAVGSVYDQDTKIPISNVTITIQSTNSDDPITIVTDSDGRFHVTGLNDGYYTWSLTHESYEDAEYENYDVCAGEGTAIFSFYMSNVAPIQKRAYEAEDLSNPDDIPNTISEEGIAPLSFTGTPQLSSFTVGVGAKSNGSGGTSTKVNRYNYLAYVVSSEALGYYQCTGKGMTDAQIKQYFAAQAVASNSFLEFAAQKGGNHSSYTVCDSANCQRYDTTKTTTFTIGAVSYITTNIAGDRYYPIQVYKKNNRYDYIYPAFFAHCDGNTVKYPSSSGDNHPELQSVPCTDLMGPHSSVYGNGWGLCQEGAAYRAKQGSSYMNILSYYYDSTVTLVCPE